MTQDSYLDAPAHSAGTIDEPQEHRALLVSRVIDALLAVATVGTVVSVLYGGSQDGEVGTATIMFVLTSTVWILLGLTYAAIRIRRIRRARQGDQRWPGWLAGRRANRLIILGTAIIVLGAGSNIALTKGDDDNSYLIRVFAIAMVLVAWTILQLSYAERYARLYVENVEGSAPLDFPGTPNPTLLEFAYFSFSVGSTFGTSDVAIQSSRFRGIVMCHGLLAFVYNTAVLGMVLSLISG
jgi:uncharacterized membrane protein